MRRSQGEGNIIQRKDGLWAGSLRVPGKRLWVYGKTAKEAAEKLQALRQRQTGGTLAAPSKLSVGVYFDQWLSYIATTKRPSTLHGYTCVVRAHLKPALGHLKLQQLAPVHLVQLYAAKRQAGLSPRRVRIIHAVAHKALADAVRWRLIPTNVAAQVDPPAWQPTPAQVWTLDEARCFLQVATKSKARYAPAIVLALTLGLREGELCGLR